MRHSAATLLPREDVHPKVAQEMLGHSRIGVTLDTYSHAVPSMQRDVADKLDRLFAAVELKAKEQESGGDSSACDSRLPIADDDWLQSGYKFPEEAFADEDGEAANLAEFEESEEWSHADSNGGPPACEKDRGKVRRRPRTSDVVDSRQVSKKR